MCFDTLAKRYFFLINTLPLDEYILCQNLGSFGLSPIVICDGLLNSEPAIY